ncbi:MAG: hypothetical protein KJO81_07155 [Gammaproteobacteria bacterium]|nr:hypothetical protein [Gammaproteobacteria bacterium]MBT8124584.1 hypothetical protein [Gammaproteobacteria bacterium]NNC67955.1 hypothetical protein [Gammaproteobacteria bacterium]
MRAVIRYFFLCGFFALFVSCGGKNSAYEISEEKTAEAINDAQMNNVLMHDLLQRIGPELQG